MDTKYWSNPQVYITCDGFSEALDGPHFVLYNFKTNHLIPLDDKLKSISMMGELRYKVGIFQHAIHVLYTYTRDPTIPVRPIALRFGAGTQVFVSGS